MPEEATVFSVGLSSALCIFATYGFIMAAVAFGRLQDAALDWDNVILHWEAEPVVDFQLVDGACPQGFEEGTASQDLVALQRIGKWDGSNAWCDCGTPAFTHTYTYTQFRCVYTGSTAAWGSGRCPRDNSTHTTESRTQTEVQSFTTSSGACSANATKAGCVTDPALPSVNLNYFGGKRVCIKRGGTPAIDRPVLEKGKSCPRGWIQCGTGNYDDDGNVCAKSTSECPIVNLGTFDNLNTTTGADGSSGRPIVEVWITMGNACFKGEDGVSGRSNNERVKDKRNQNCEEYDTRYTSWATEPESSYYSWNNVPTGGGHTLDPEDSSLGIQTSPIQNYSTNSAVTWHLSYRHEIYWSSDCELGNMEDIKDYNGPIGEVESIQMVLLICCGIFGFTLSFIMCCIESYDYYDGEAMSYAKVTAPYVGLGCAWVAHVAKMVPLIWCFVSISRVDSWFEDASRSKCSDDLTDDIIQTASELLVGVYNANIQNTVVEVLMIIVHIFQMVGTFVCKEGMIHDYCSVIKEPAAEEDKVDKEEGGDTAPEENVEVEMEQ